MSHVAAQTYAIKDLETFIKVAEQRGFEFMKDQKTYKWWGYSVGDYPLPKGFKESDLGKCVHALRIKPEGRKYQDAFEIGIVQNPEGEGFILLFDFFGQTELVKRMGGEAAEGLIQDYSLAALQNSQDILALKQLGYAETTLVDEETDDLIIVLES